MIYIYIYRVLSIYDFEALKKKEKRNKEASAYSSDSDELNQSKSSIDSVWYKKIQIYNIVFY